MNGSGAASSAYREMGEECDPLSLSSPDCPALSDAAIPRYQPADRNHGGLASAWDRLRLGYRADIRDRPLYDRGSLRDRRRRRAREAGICGISRKNWAISSGLTRAVKLQTTASSVGFDWNEARLVLAKIREETDEIEVALDARESAAIAEEIGDLLFSVANLARHVEADPEAAIRRANAKFERRFRFIEDALAAKGTASGAAALADMETLWNMAKQSEKRVTP